MTVLLVLVHPRRGRGRRRRRRPALPRSDPARPRGPAMSTPERRSPTTGPARLGYPLELAHLSWLHRQLGRRRASAAYPTIEEFRFGQEVTFSTDGRPFLSYWSRTWLLDDEGNRIRPSRHGGRLLASAARQPASRWCSRTRAATPRSGSARSPSTRSTNAVITGARAELHTDVVARTSPPRSTRGGSRLYGLVEGDLLWAYDMAAVGQPLTAHLSARLKRA